MTAFKGQQQKGVDAVATVWRDSISEHRNKFPSDVKSEEKNKLIQIKVEKLFVLEVCH